MDKQYKGETSVLVLLDASLLKAIDKCAKKLHYTREQFILMACQQLIGQIDVRELERIYCERLKQQPEELELAETGTILASQILPKEAW